MNYNDYLSETVIKMKPSGIREFFDIVNTMEGAISLGVGEPDFITPYSVRDAAIKSIQKGYTQYSSNAGIPELRTLISKYMKERYGLNYDGNSEIIATVGSSEAIDIAMRALVNPGDEILVPEPSYVSYEPCVLLAGGVPIPIKCTMENSFKITAEDIEKAITKKTKAIIFPYPNNPTGAIMEREYLDAICDTIKKHDLIVLSDEIYSELTYSLDHVSIASLAGMWERTVVLSGFSKSFAMTGWRLGFLCAPKGLCSMMIKIHQYVIMCAPTASQFAGIHALKEGFTNNFKSVCEMRDEYDKRRKFMYSELLDMGLECFEPKGAFYLFPRVKSTGLDGGQFARNLLDQKKVAVVPGAAFGESTKDYIRISYAYSMRNLKIAIEKIREFVNELKG